MITFSLNTRISCSKYSSPSSPPGGRQSKYSGQAVRALPIRILTVGRKRSQGVQLLVDEYKDKLKLYCNFEDILIRSNPKNTSNVKAQIEGEDALVMQHIKSGDWVVLLDEHGLDIGSEQMADMVGDAGNSGSSTLSFCIGGPYGHGRQVRERANVTIKLSSMVLNHQIALVVLLEQLYRAWTILKGQKYHH
ncbi:hypothetical protein C5167_029230 [Papaver somniferum]|uniref:putative RNA methyltransferase At5g10620 n=1 Tax=Papaver somniferum TaxID=3469 RepID=UPI000E705527|nr:putative RNA methyltransferase At5g10620 [Papaver somniferum]RZC89327.1 hypothetical protein C5167_029230 [Papaver somniferum]